MRSGKVPKKIPNPQRKQDAKLKIKLATSDTKLQLTTVSERLQFSLNSGSQIPNVAQKAPHSLRIWEKSPSLRNKSHKLKTGVIKEILDWNIECFGHAVSLLERGTPLRGLQKDAHCTPIPDFQLTLSVP